MATKLELDESRSEPERGRFVWNALPEAEARPLLLELRKVLLGQLEGPAITRVCFDDLTEPNEFSTLPGVSEALCELALNLKPIRLKLLQPPPVKLRLEVRGPGQVTAADLQTSGAAEVLTPQRPIAELAADAHLRMDLFVETGRSYRSAEENRRPEDPSLFPLDALFSPVLRVDVELEPVEGTDAVRPVLTVQTDGSLTPGDALAFATSALAT